MLMITDLATRWEQLETALGSVPLPEAKRETGAA